jgi:hypothetical protein
MFGGEPMDIENCHLNYKSARSLHTSIKRMKNRVVMDYAKRDRMEFEKSGVNFTLYMIEKAQKYKIKVTSLALQYAKEKSFKEFYSTFTLDDLCVLGY